MNCQEKHLKCWFFSLSISPNFSIFSGFFFATFFFTFSFFFIIYLFTFSFLSIFIFYCLFALCIFFLIKPFFVFLFYFTFNVWFYFFYNLWFLDCLFFLDKSSFLVADLIWLNMNVFCWAGWTFILLLTTFYLLDHFLFAILLDLLYSDLICLSDIFIPIPLKLLLLPFSSSLLQGIASPNFIVEIWYSESDIFHDIIFIHFWWIQCGRNDKYNFYEFKW